MILSRTISAGVVLRRREETAATRSLLNTAKVKKIDKISVYGGLDGVLKDLVKIRP